MNQNVPKHANAMARRATALVVAANAGTRSTRHLALTGEILDDLTEDQLRSLAVFLALHTDLSLIAETASLTLTTPELIARAVEESAVRFGVSADEILSGQRSREVVEARHVAMYAARLSGISLTAIGAEFGRDHSSVLHAAVRVGENARLRRIGTRIATSVARGRHSEEVA